jgi:hypothetical protein
MNASSNAFNFGSYNTNTTGSNYGLGSSLPPLSAASFQEAGDLGMLMNQATAGYGMFSQVSKFCVSSSHHYFSGHIHAGYHHSAGGRSSTAL